MSRDKAPPGGKGRGRVLVVDDDPTARTTLEAILGEDFDVASAGTAAEAIQHLEKQAFDVLVTDHEMPGDNGAKLIATARDRWPGMSMILLTGHSEYTEVRELQKAGRVLVLFKPLEPSQLVSWVKNGVTMASLTRATSRLHSMKDSKATKKKEEPEA